MSAIGKKILDELGDTAIRWLESVGRKVTEQKFVPLPIEKMAEDLGQNIVGLETKAPEFFNIYEAFNLYNTMKSGDLVLTKPDTFRDLAAKLPDDLDEIYGPQLMDESYGKVEEIADLIKSGIPLESVPYLQYQFPKDNIMQIIGHEGRHRNRALKQAGFDQSLVNLVPRASSERVPLGLPMIRQDPKIFDEMTRFRSEKNRGGKETGSLGELMEIVNIPSYKQFGALRDIK